MEKKHVITISREYGSGGHAVGHQLAEYLGIPCYDRAGMEKLTTGEDFSNEALEERELKEKNSFMFNLSASLGFTHDIDREHFEEQCKMIEQLYETGSCVIIGRCADYVLKGKPDVTSIFLFADEKVRVARAIKEYGLEPEQAYRWLTISDRTRENYYNHFTGLKWGDADNYHLSINTEHIDIGSLVKLIARYVELRG